jgi:FkbM family methyltransferase
MRKELFYNPLVLFQRIGEWAETSHRLFRLRRTVASPLHDGHIDTLELLELLQPLDPRVIFDIGANIGTWTLLAKALYPNSEIHAFEPLEQHKGKFLASVGGIPGVTLHEVALGTEGACAKMHVNNFSDTSSVLELTQIGRREFGLSKVNEFAVRLRGLDKFVTDYTIRLPDVIKLDVQGFELEVLKHATQVLAHAKAVISEVSFKEIYAGQCRFEDMIAFLSTNKFYVYAFSVRTPLGRPIFQTDVLFLKRSE